MSNIAEINKLVEQLAQDPYNHEVLFSLAFLHETIGEHAGAITFYLKAAEFTQTTELAYESLCRMFMIYMMAGNRITTAKRCLNQAIALQPGRPEAYFLISQFYENTQQWQECYTASQIGLQFAHNNQPTVTDLKYYHPDQFVFQQALSAWWIGQFEESRKIFRQLAKKDTLPDLAELIEKNITVMGNGPYPVCTYIGNCHNLLRYKFPGSEKIQRNFSQCMQDMFALCATNGKSNGTYLEIGSGKPFYNNNTALLEQQFGWTGLSIEIDKSLCDIFNIERKNPCYHGDATQADYENLLQNNFDVDDIDYLQIDCEPPNVSYEVLTKIPFDQYRFAAITFEHDYYADEEKIYREKSRQFLREKGYILAAGNIAPNTRDSFEDWWVHPDLIEQHILDALCCPDENVLFVEDYMLCDNSHQSPEKT